MYHFHDIWEEKKNKILKKYITRVSIHRRVASFFKKKRTKNVFLKVNTKNNFFQKFLFYIFLVFLVFYFTYNYFLQKLETKNLPCIYPHISIQLFNPIISTPYIIQTNTKKFLLFVADVAGNVYGISIPDGNIEFIYKMPGPVIASLSGTDCNKDSILETLVSDQIGNYVFLDIGGNFLYKNRHLGNGFFSKSLILNSKEVSIFSDISGEIHCIQNNYGKVLWKSKFSSEYSFYSTPIVIEKNGILIGFFLSRDGALLILDLSTGTILHKGNLKGSFVSSPCIGNFLGKFNDIQCAIISTEGTIFLLDTNSYEVIQTISLNKEVVSSPIRISTKNTTEIMLHQLIVSAKGTIYKINFKKKSILKLFNQITNNSSIRATSVLLDFNGDGKNDILTVTSHGVIHTYDEFGEKIYEDFLLKKEITATPVFFRNKNKNFGIFCGENGTIDVLIFPQNIFTIENFFQKKNMLLYPEFLGNANNQNDIKYYRKK